MALPSDRASLLSLAADTERAVAETAHSGDKETMRTHATELLRLGEIRFQLGELQNAEGLFERAAAAFWKSDFPFAREAAVMATIRQSNMAMVEHRFDDAVRIIDGLIEQCGGFPDFLETSQVRVAGLDAWLSLLDIAEDNPRLYDAAGTALTLLDANGPPAEQKLITETLVRRAKTADALGNEEEAAEAYGKAIARLEAESPAATGQLAECMLRHAVILGNLDRIEETSDVFARILAQFDTSTEPWAKDAVALAQRWLEAAASDD